jgi:glutamine amidotransferase
MTKICVLDYGSGNVRSVFNLFNSINQSVIISNQHKDIKNASHIVLPGVGSFGSAMNNIKLNIPLGILEGEVLNKGKPFLGICVGMQVMATESSEFGKHLGLNWISGEVKKISADLPLPHIGWNNLKIFQNSKLLEGINEDLDFYFVHSFKFHLNDSSLLVASSEYGESIPSIINKENLFGVQFHPEKSQVAGKKLAINFLKIK